MKMIKKYVDAIDDELHGAEHYSEKYIECKVNGNTAFAEKYKEMAKDELKHAMYEHEFAKDAIDKLSKIYTAPPEMLKKWEESHLEYIEKTAGIKKLLEM